MAVHGPNKIDVEITDEREVDLQDLQYKIMKGLKMDTRYARTLGKAVDVGARTVSGLDPTQGGELKVALRDPEWASKPNGSVNLPSPTPALQIGALTPFPRQIR